MATPLALPPNTSAETFTCFLDETSKAVGAENIQVITSADELDDGSYRNQPYTHDPHHILDQDYFVASAVVCPRSVPDIQTIVRAANEF